MNEELTEQEMVFYANYGLIGECDGCGDNAVPITNRNDGKNYLTITGNKIYCQKCLKTAEPSARKRES